MCCLNSLPNCDTTRCVIRTAVCLCTITNCKSKCILCFTSFTWFTRTICNCMSVVIIITNCNATTCSNCYITTNGNTIFAISLITSTNSNITVTLQCIFVTKSYRTAATLIRSISTFNNIFCTNGNANFITILGRSYIISICSTRTWLTICCISFWSSCPNINLLG